MVVNALMCALKQFVSRSSVVSGLCPRTAAFLCLPGAGHRVFPEAEAGDAERDAASRGQSA